MNLQKLFENFVLKVRLLGRVRGTKLSNKHHFNQLKEHGVKIRKLNSAQKKKVDAIFKNKYKCKYTYATHELYYSVTGKFNPAIIPEDLFRIQIEHQLNDSNSKNVLADKSYFDRFLPTANFPSTIIRNIEGLFFDKNYKLISKEEASDICYQHDKLVFKPSLDSGCGRGVHLVDLKEENPLDNDFKNYIIQELIVQHPALSKLNSSSVNIVRVMTWFNGKEIIPLISALRVGGEGFFADNQTTANGMGMTITGLDENGICNEMTCYSCGVLTDKSASGVILKGYEIPKYKEMVKEAKKLHEQLPRLGFIAWDFTVNDKDEVILIEYNIKCPGILYYQYVNGPLLNNHTDEFLSKYLKKKY